MYTIGPFNYGPRNAVLIINYGARNAVLMLCPTITPVCTLF